MKVYRMEGKKGKKLKRGKGKGIYYYYYYYYCYYYYKREREWCYYGIIRLVYLLFIIYYV